MKLAVMLAFAGSVAAGSALASDVTTIATHPQGSLAYTAGVAIAKVLDEKLQRPFRVQPTAGSSTFMPLLNTNEVQFGIANVDDSQTAHSGTGAYTKPNPELRLINIMFPLPLGIMVPADSPVKKIADLKGVRMGSGYAGMTTGRVIQEAALANAGLEPDAVRGVPVVNMFAAVDLVASGRADAAAIGPGTPQVQKAHAELSSRGGVRFISIDTTPDAVARMQKVMPSRPLRIDPAPHLVGVLEPIMVMAYSMYFIGNSKLPDDLVYNVAKTLHANRDPLVAAAPALQRFDPQRMTEKVSVPFHPGAIKFYTEIGQWPPKD
ncbi:MAG: TAXI family TRAP transporter solute-binding subunit [Rhodospirillales bacterium]